MENFPEDAEEMKRINIFKFIPDIIFRVKKDGTILDYFGDRDKFLVPPEEFLGRKLKDVMPGDIGIEATKVIKDVLKRGKEGEFEYTLPLPYPDGELHFYEARIIKIDKDEVIIIVRDITDKKIKEISLKKRGEWFKFLSEMTPAAVFIHNGEKYIYVNPSMEKITGYSKEELLNMKLWEIIHPKHREMVKNFARKRILGEDVPDRYEVEVLTKNGGRVWINISAKRIIYEGKPFVLGTACDLTELKRAEEKYRTLVEKMSEGVYILYNNRFEFVNKKFVEMFGYTKEELKNIDFRKLIAPESLPMIEERIEKLKRGEKVPETYEFVALSKDGKRIYVEVSVTYVPYKEGTATQGIVRDIREKKIYENKLKYMATHDLLTGLINRSYFMDFLKTSIENAKRYGHLTCVMMLDLDGFKEINDNFGHDIGDEVLIKVSERLKSCVRKSDVISRMGGDEFLILVPILKSVEDAIGMGRKIVNNFRTPFEVGGNSYILTISIGAAIFPNDGDNGIELIKKADRAMYNIKRNGKNGFCLYSELVKDG